MAIVRMSKFTLIAFEARKNEILKKLQTFGEVEFINLQSKKLAEEDEALSFLREDTLDLSTKVLEDNLSRLKNAIGFLNTYIPKESTFKALKTGKSLLSYEDLSEYGKSENWSTICDAVKNKEERLNEIDANIAKIRTHLDILRPWQKLDIHFELLNDLKKTMYFIGSLQKQKLELLRSELHNNFKYVDIETINEDAKFAYILILVHLEECKALEELLKVLEFSEFKAHYKEKPEILIGSFEETLNKLISEKINIEEELKTYKEQQSSLKLAQEYFENKLIRFNSCENFLKSDRTIVISGWFPEEKKEIFENFIKAIPDFDYFLDISQASNEDIDTVPIKLINNKLIKSFESITAMYSLPKYDGVDPTPLLAPFYMIFFGMMVADVAYGIIVFFAAFFALKKLKLDEKKENFIRMFMYLGITTMIWGLIYGSVFGDVIKIPSLINPSKDIYTVVFLSIGFGALQILVGLGIKAYVLIRDGKPWAAFFDSGAWIITLISAGLLLGLGLSTAKYTMFLGMLIIILTNGRDAKTYGGKLASGLYALYGITGYVGDLISYTRLMALGIAGGSIAGAMNLIIGYFPGISLFIIGPVLFIAIHIFNMLLGLLGAYVHTCRLQYVEFFSKFYSGGGKPFTPFKMLNKYINVKQLIEK